MPVMNVHRYRFFRTILRMMLSTAFCVIFIVTLFSATGSAYALSLNKSSASEPVRTIDDVQKATIRIATVGTYIDPSDILPSASSGRGSGFIIDSSGLAMTNNHIVTGATYINVWIDGEDQPRNARVVAVSECADLAVIDIDGDGFPYLEWSGQTLNTGLAVYAAGFPGGDSEFALTNGAITNVTSNGDTHWASLTHVVEHSATIYPGSSGGPLVDSNGKLVAINYAGQPRDSQYFAISRDQVLPLLTQLRSGQDVDAIGVNGVAVVVGEINPLTGIWVSSIEIGSLAHRTGVLPGDILVSLNDLPLAADGSMADYCDILRNHGPSDVLNLRVLRRSNRQILVGQLNGSALQSTLPYFGNFMGERLTQMREGLNQGVMVEAISISEIQSLIGGVSLENSYVSTQSSALTSILPASWLDIASDIWTLGNDWLGVKFQASADLEAMTQERWTTSGAIIYTSSQLASRIVPEEFLTSIDLSRKCASRERSLHVHTANGQTYRGAYDQWRDCGTVDSEVIVFVVVDDQKERLYLVEFYILGPEDLEAFEVFRKTFYHTGSLAEIVRPPTLAEIPVGEPEPDPTVFEPISSLKLQAPAGTLSIEMPGVWRAISTGEWIVSDDDDGQKNAGFELVAQPEASGEALAQVTYRISTDLQDLTKSTIFLDRYKHMKRCRTVARKGYRNELNRGAYDLWTDCDDPEMAYVIAATEPIENQVGGDKYILSLFVQLNDLSGIDAIEPMLATLQYELPSGNAPVVVDSTPSAQPEPAAISETPEPATPEPATPEPATSIADGSATATAVTATVLVPGLNVRYGPNTSYERIDRVTLDQILEVRGADRNCAWLQVITPNNVSGWVSGDPELVTLNGTCSQISQ